MNKLKAHVVRMFERRALGFYLFASQPDGRVAFGTNVAMVTQSDTEMPPYEPTFFLSEENAQELMDQLWDAGIRPEAAKDRSEVVAAMKVNLEDVRWMAREMLDLVKGGKKE